MNSAAKVHDATGTGGVKTVAELPKGVAFEIHSYVQIFSYRQYDRENGSSLVPMKYRRLHGNLMAFQRYHSRFRGLPVMKFDGLVERFHGAILSKSEYPKVLIQDVLSFLGERHYGVL